MYTVFLAIHNILRWIVIILAAIALVRAYLGWFGRRDWTETDRKVGIFFASAVDTQLLLGLILYFFLSPVTRPIFSNFNLAMQNPETRFFGLEHILWMVMAVFLVHVGNVLSRRADLPSKSHMAAALWYTLAVVLILVAIPWTRPLFPGLGGV
jgi:hypothetical protein